jgi:hypothetical protein
MCSAHCSSDSEFYFGRLCFPARFKKAERRYLLKIFVRIHDDKKCVRSNTTSNKISIATPLKHWNMFKLFVSRLPTIGLPGRQHPG